MMGTDKITEASTQAAEAIRTLNHLTLPGAGNLEYPADVYAIIADLRLVAQRLPQLLKQCSAWLEGEHKAGRVGHDTGAHTGRYVATVAGRMEDAAAVATHLEAWLAGAQSACGHLTGLGSKEG